MICRRERPVLSFIVLPRKLPAPLLVGLVANAVAGYWWADPLAALLMVPWLIKEGIEGLRGEEEDDD